MESIELQRTYDGYCPECGYILEFEPEELKGGVVTCTGCDVELEPYCELCEDADW